MDVINEKECWSGKRRVLNEVPKLLGGGEARESVKTLVLVNTNLDLITP